MKTEMELEACVAREPNIFEVFVNRVRRVFQRKKPSNSYLHALREFRAIGYKPIAECEDGPNKWIQENVFELLEVFSRQGHSGFSAPYCINTFAKLAKFEPLCPLMGADGEWNDVGSKVLQNNRCSHVFKEDGGQAYDINAIIYEEPSGACFTKGGARHYIEFPYTPTRKYIKVDFEGNEVSDEVFAELRAAYEAKAEAA